VAGFCLAATSPSIAQGEEHLTILLLEFPTCFNQLELIATAVQTVTEQSTVRLEVWCVLAIWQSRTFRHDSIGKSQRQVSLHSRSRHGGVKKHRCGFGRQKHGF
jgi:hypothetical protein